MTELAKEHARTECHRADELWRKSAVENLQPLESPSEQRAFALRVFESGLLRYHAEIAQLQLANIDQARAVLIYLQGAGARWVGGGQGFAYVYETDASTAKGLADKADDTRRALLDTERAGP